MTKNCLKCYKTKDVSEFPTTLPVCGECLMPRQGERTDKKRGGKSKINAGLILTCEVCGRKKPATRFSAAAKVQFNATLCRYCATRAGVLPLNTKPKIMCLQCETKKPETQFPAGWRIYGQYCRACRNRGLIKKEGQK